MLEYPRVLFSVFFVLLFSFSTPVWAGKTVYITRDNGGVIIDYVAKRLTYEKYHQQIAIVGECLSACTLYLKSPNVCVGAEAVLGFHRASSKSGTQLLMSQYPPSIRSWVKAQGGLTSKVIYLQGPALRARVRTCS